MGITGLLKVKGRNRLVICALLLLVPLLYPFKTLFREPINLSVPADTFEALRLDLLKPAILNNADKVKGLSGSSSDTVDEGVNEPSPPQATGYQK